MCMVGGVGMKCLRTLRVICFNLHSSQHQHQEGHRLHVHGEDGLLSGSAMKLACEAAVNVSTIASTGSC